MAKKAALGRGLDFLLETNTTPQISGSSSINEIDINYIEPNPDQPRRAFDEDALDELASSIKEIGIITPITLKKVSDVKYIIIAGERRYRAAKKVGLGSLPAYVKTADDKQVLEMALVENIQREDLNSIEIAIAYQNLLEQLNITQEELSERVGKKRATIANYIRLLKLPAEVQMGIKDKKIDMGHARAIASLSDPKQQISTYEEIVNKGLSVRDAELYVHNLTNKKAPSAPKSQPNDIKVIVDDIKTTWGNKVQLSCNANGKGKVSIAVANKEELIAIVQKLKKTL